MLPGTNTVELNTASLIEIVQYYFDNKLLNPHEIKPRVTNVQGSSGMAPTFKITIEEATK